MNSYLPRQVKILKIEEQSPIVKLFRITPILGNFKKNKNGLIFIPGQFVLVGNIGYGESAFGPLSSPYENEFLEIAVRNTGGIVTNYLHSLNEGDIITARGPFGNGFPLNFLKNKDVLTATGGCGVPPIAALIEYIIENRNNYHKIYLLYGAKSPDEILLKNKQERWKNKGINIILTIDKPSPAWSGHIGFITDIIKEIEIDEQNAAVVMCGPGPMMDAIEHIVKPLGISDRKIFVNMERKMQCGIGKCQHCTTGSKYVCIDGPVFNYDQIENNRD